MIHRLGGDPERLSAACGVPVDCRDTELGALPLRSFVLLTQTAAAELRAPDFGWATGEVFNISNLGEIGAAMELAPTVGAALGVLCDAFQAIQRESQMSLTVEDDEAVLAYRILNPEIWPRDQDAELTLSVVAGVLRRAVGQNWQPSTLMFEHCRNRPGTISSRRSLGSAAYDAGTNALIFPAHLLDARMPTPEPERFWSAVGQALAASAEVRRGEPLPSATRREILARLGSFRVDQTMVAGALGLSRRSLRRRLAAAHTGFSELLADCRLQLARLRLLHSRMPLAAIADELGYSDKTAFERAFRRSTGATPSRYRAQMQFPTAGSGRVASPPSL